MKNGYFVLVTNAIGVSRTNNKPGGFMDLIIKDEKGLNKIFKNVKHGILIGMMAILFGGALGISFGGWEGEIKGYLKSEALSVSQEKYEGIQEKMDKVIKKSWIYIKRAHLHSQTMGVIAIVFSLMAALFNFNSIIQWTVSLLSGLGSLGYGIFWLLAGVLAPSMGGTHQAKEAVSLIAQISGASFIIAGVMVFGALAFKIIIKQSKEAQYGLKLT